MFKLRTKSFCQFRQITLPKSNFVSSSRILSFGSSSNASLTSLDLLLLKRFTSSSIQKFSVEDWTKLGLKPEIATTLKDAFPNISTPTQIQSFAIPKILTRKHDVLFASETGSGKTLAYLLPVIQFLKEDEQVHKIEIRSKRPRALVLAPSRELAHQILGVAKKLSHVLKFRSTSVLGGEEMRLEKKELDTKVDLLVATPGRLTQHLQNGNVFFTDVRHVVVDEADTLFDKDYGTMLEKLFLPIRNRKADLPMYLYPTRFIMSTATLTPHISDLIKKSFPEAVRVTSESLHKILKTLKQTFVPVPSGDKFPILVSILNKEKSLQKTIIFCNKIPSCQATEHFVRELGYSCTSFYGEIPPKTREENYEKFMRGQCDILITSDLGSRGLDTLHVDHIILFDFPVNPVDYLHRVGRTARAGHVGRVTALVTKRDQDLATAIKVASSENEALDSVPIRTRKVQMRIPKLSSQVLSKPLNPSVEEFMKGVSKPKFPRQSKSEQSQQSSKSTKETQQSKSKQSQQSSKSTKETQQHKSKQTLRTKSKQSQRSSTSPQPQRRSKSKKPHRRGPESRELKKSKS